MVELTDTMAEDLLRLILVAVAEYGGTEPTMTISEFVDDIAMSMDHTSDFADRQRQLIHENLA